VTRHPRPAVVGSILKEKTREGLIRLLLPDDRGPIHRFLDETHMFSQEEIGIALELIETVLTRPEQKDYVIFVYESDGDVLGYYCIGPTPGTNGTFDLYWIAVAPSAQGKGIGRTLNRHAEAFVRERGGRLVIAETSSQEKYADTRKFYLAQGYDEVGRIRDYYRLGDDLVIYGKYLTQVNEGG
jgi:aminoglycoside 6'-N-acetyltransferase I